MFEIIPIKFTPCYAGWEYFIYHQPWPYWTLTINYTTTGGCVLLKCWKQTKQTNWARVMFLSNISCYKSYWWQIIKQNAPLSRWNVVGDYEQTMNYTWPKEHMVHNFTKYFSGTQLNQIVNKYLNGYLVLAACYFWLQ